MKTETKARIRLVFIGLAAMACLAVVMMLTSRLLPAGWLRLPGPQVTVAVQREDVSGAGARLATGEGGQMDIRLSEGMPQPQGIETPPPAVGEPLSADEIARLLARLPALEADPADQTAFQLPPELLPPPRPGKTVRESFPPIETEAGPGAGIETGPLRVLRYAPEGEIAIAPFLSITFNQPMAPLGTLDALTEREVPVSLEPPLPGTWRWVGTRTLTFEYASDQIDRLPKATTYRVTVPAGTKSLAGGVLAEAVTWTFTTPPPRLVQTYPPDRPQPLDPLFVLVFDQRIDPAAMLPFVTVEAGGQAVEIRPASAEETQEMAGQQPEGRWLAFKTRAPLPAATRVTVTVRPGAPSAEGPLVTREAQSYSFSTYAPLRIEEYGCGWYGGDCLPLTSFNIRFNNPLDEEAFREGWVKIVPELPGALANASGSILTIQGETRADTVYSVTLSGEIRDVFGQTLGREQTVTFRVSRAEPLLAGPDAPFVTLDPSAQQPALTLYALNHKRLDVQVYAVQPQDWPAFKEYLRTWQNNQPAPLPGSLLMAKTLTLDIPDNTLTQIQIPLEEYTAQGYRQFIVIATPPKPLIELDPWRRRSQTVQVWVQVTRLALDAFHDQSQMTVWATDLQTGAPLEGVTVTAGEQQFRTGTDGTARFAIPEGAAYLTARKGEELALLPRSTSPWSDETWSSFPVRDSLRWYVFDDRAMYRPGEEVHLKGWVRLLTGGQKGDVRLAQGLNQVNYRVFDATGNELTSGQTSVNRWGGFDLAFRLPEQVNLGSASVFFESQMGMDGSTYSHTFQIQEFRRPEFEVMARNETSGPYFAGGFAVVAVKAAYYAGGPLPNADVTWQVTTAPGSYAPPHWPDFIFGSWTPWWSRSGPWPPQPGVWKTETFAGKTDAGGEHYLRLDFDLQGQPVEPRPLSITAEATVMDVNRQAWVSATTLLVHPAEVYIGLRSERYFVPRGTPIKVEFIVTDLDGNPFPGRPVEITAARMVWRNVKGEWREQAAETQTCTLNSGNAPLACTFETPLGGSYRITATVTDLQGRRNQTSILRWVGGGEQPSASRVEQEQVTLIPDRDSYQPGETAQILVQSPWPVAEGLLTVSREGTLYTERFSVRDGTATLSIPIRAEYLPNLRVQVDLTGEAPRTDERGERIPGAPPRPAYATGTLNLSIPPLSRALALEVTPAQTRLEPGGRTTLDVTVKDASGQPVENAEVAVVVVDEAILALTGYTLRDPLQIFYPEREASLFATYARASIVLLDPAVLRQQVQNAAQERFFRAPMAGAPPVMATQMASQPEAAPGQGGQAEAGIRIRTDFNPLANFSPSVRTNFFGKASIEIRLPDNLTRYRILVVAVDESGQRFGAGEASLTARLPLMVRPSAPRFLNFGDRFELPVVLQNQTDLPMTVEVALRTANLEPAQAGVRVTLPANDRVEVRFPLRTVRAGTARLQVVAVSGEYADAAALKWPVFTPATSEAFAVYGVVDEGSIAQPVQTPGGVFAEYGGLEISTSSTALSALTDAFLYLQTYPFECSEQLASRILSVAALRDVLTAFQAEGLPAPEEIQAAVRRDVDKLAGMQNSDGGFPAWQRGYESIPFNTIHVTHALLRARQKGFDVPPEMLKRALDYLWNIEQRYPAWYEPPTRRTLSAYALYVRSLDGDRDSVKAEKLLREAGLENLQVDAIGWLWPVIEDAGLRSEIRRFVGNRVVETAGAANFTTGYDEQSYLLLSSDRRTDAILLDALMGDNPQSDLIPKLVNGLLAHRTRGRWNNTQENVFILLALDRYFRTYEAQTPDFVARIWLGPAYAGQSEFRGRSTEQHERTIPMQFVLSQAPAGALQDLILSKEGTGRLYYRLGLRYAPTDFDLPPLERGFVVTRTYEAVDDPGDVYRDAEGRWHIRAGARVRVKLTMVADNRRYHVALVDPLPAGLEIINPALAVTGSMPQEPVQPSPQRWWWWGPWYEHQNLRDTRAEAFATLLWDGVYQYSYIARATTPGTFIVPPAKAEEMYSPEVFGRSASDWVIVE